MAVFWVVAPCSMVEVYHRFRGHRCVHHQGDDDGGSKDLSNVGELLPDYTAQQPRRQPSSYSPPWEHQILLVLKVLLLFTHWITKFIKIIFKNLIPTTKKIPRYRHQLITLFKETTTVHSENHTNTMNTLWAKCVVTTIVSFALLDTRVASVRT
jgi:hypothetical protein